MAEAIRQKYGLAADDRPIDYSFYLNMSQEELDAEIERLEAEARKERDKIKNKNGLAKAL